MSIDKFYRGIVGKGGLQVTGASTLSTLEVRSGFNLSGAVSMSTLNVRSGANFYGATSMATLTVQSGANLLGTTSLATLNVGSNGAFLGANSFATVNVGSNTIVFGTASVNILNVRSDAIFFGTTSLQTANIDKIVGSTKLAGIATIASGGTTVTVSLVNLAVNSTGGAVLGNMASVASHIDITLTTNSYVANTSFLITADKATVDSLKVVYVAIPV